MLDLLFQHLLLLLLKLQSFYLNVKGFYITVVKAFDIDENATEHRLILGIKDNKNNNNT